MTIHFSSVSSIDVSFSVIPPVYVPVCDRAVFDSTASEHMQIQPDSTVPMDCTLTFMFSLSRFVFQILVLVATSPNDQQRTAVNSPVSIQDGYEAMTPTQTTINQTIVPQNHFNSGKE